MRSTFSIIFLLALTGMAAGTQAQSIFQVVPTPEGNLPEPGNNYLYAASASSPSDIWAVGATTIHFDGTQWTAYRAPGMPGLGTSWLRGVVDISPTEAWAGGLINIDTEDKTPSQVIERWNGTEWNVFPGPQFASGDQPSINGMAGISATDIWTAGSMLTSDGGLESLFEHWDGTAWTAVTGPLHGFPEAISADAANDIWVVGYNPGGLAFSTAAYHYNGTSWSPVTTPNVGSGSNSLNGVLALAPNNVWAVGYSTASTKPPPNQYEVPTKTLIVHYDGTGWSVVPSPNVGPNTQYQSNRLLGLTAVSPTDIWAFGSYFAASGSNNQMTLVMHWDGTSWTLAASPNPQANSILNDILWGGVATAPGSVWIVGSEDVFYTLVLHTTGG